MGLVKYQVENTIPEATSIIRALGRKCKKTVSKKEWKELEKQGYELIRRNYFLLTPLSDWWSRLSDSNKITIIIAIGTAVVALVIDFK